MFEGLSLLIFRQPTAFKHKNPSSSTATKPRIAATSAAAGITPSHAARISGEIIGFANFFFECRFHIWTWISHLELNVAPTFELNADLASELWMRILRLNIGCGSRVWALNVDLAFEALNADIASKILNTNLMFETRVLALVKRFFKFELFLLFLSYSEILDLSVIKAQSFWPWRWA